MLTASDLAFMRATQDEALPDTCTIQQKTLTSDGMGGYTEGWTDRATDVACRLAPATYRPGEQVIAEQQVGSSLWQLTLPAGQVIEASDRVVVAGVTYEVVGVHSGGAWETAKRALLIRLE